MKFLLSTTQAFFYLSFVSSVLGSGSQSDSNDTVTPAPAPAPIDPCRNNNCNKAGKCNVVDGAAICVCENTFVHNANRDGCICPEGTTLNAGSNRCFAPPTSSPSVETGPPTLLSTLAPTASPSFKIKVPVPDDDECQDNTLFEFMLEMTGNIVGCEWLTANSNRADIRKSNYCDRADVQGACQSSCDNCQCGDDDNFTFNLPNTRNEVVKNCAYINQNPNRVIQRRNTLCYADSDCREASAIGEACAAACGFCDGTSTTFCTRTDPPSPSPTVSPTKSPTVPSLCSPSSPSKGYGGYGGSPTYEGSAPSKGYGESAPSKGSCGQSSPSKGYTSPSKGSTPAPIPSMHRARRRRMKNRTE